MAVWCCSFAVEFVCWFRGCNVFSEFYNFCVCMLCAESLFEYSAKFLFSICSLSLLILFLLILRDCSVDVLSFDGCVVVWCLSVEMI